jgi:hypothetical protein
MQASSSPHGNELSVRKEQLSWRLWGVQYRKQRISWLNAHQKGFEDEDKWLTKLLEDYPMQMQDDDLLSGPYTD